MAQLPANERQFIAGVSAATGIDPRVLATWIAGEGHPGDLYNNYMNITAGTADYNASRSGSPRSVGTAAAGTAEFPDVQSGITATVAEINALGLNHFAGETPRQEIADIAATNWASSHYGGPGGPNLVNDFAGMFGSAAVDSPYQGKGSAASAAITGNIPTTYGQVKGAVTGDINSITSGLSFFTSWRFAEIVGGSLLLLLGLLLLGKQFGVSSPVRVPVVG